MKDSKGAFPLGSLWETPKQWKKRTGKAWPDNAAVYFIEPPGTTNWDIHSHKTARRYGLVCVVATEAGPPPNDWRPE
jgi:hypothetical protein